MRVLFIHPRWPKIEEQTAFNLPPLGMVQAAGCLPEDVEVRAVNENVEEVDPDCDYDLIAKLAVGGMAEIFLADRKDGTATDHVVIKRILPHLSKDNEYKAMFAEEAKLVASLNHPNIVRLYDFGCIEDMAHDQQANEHAYHRNDQSPARRATEQPVPECSADEITRSKHQDGGRHSGQDIS